MNKFHTKYYYQKQLEVNYASREKEKNNPHKLCSLSINPR